MMTGLPLEAALKALAEAGESAEVEFTSAPRRVKELAALGDAGTPPPGYTARVVKQLPGRLVCAWFHEPQP